METEEEVKGRANILKSLTAREIEILYAARKLIENEDSWCKGMARNQEYTRRCLLRAILDAAGGIDSLEGNNLAKNLNNILSLTEFNDHNTHAKVLRLIDSFISDHKKLQG